MPFDTTSREERKPTVSENLIKARDLIALTGLWCKSAWSTTNIDRHASCMADAVHIVLYGKGYCEYLEARDVDPYMWEHKGRHDRELDEQPEIRFLGRALIEMGNTWLTTYSSTERVVKFNDHEHTRHHHVMAVFDCAIALAKCREAENAKRELASVTFR